MPPATVSGTVSVLDISLVDSDTNDPLQTPRAANGTLRDTVVYSITADEWPTVRAHLDWQLARPR